MIRSLPLAVLTRTLKCWATFSRPLRGRVCVPKELITVIEICPGNGGRAMVERDLD